MRTLPLSNGSVLPAIGLGTWKTKRGEAAVAVEAALEAGYRHFDCATIYKNEAEIGEVFHHWLHSGRIRREELFIISKLWNNAHLAKHVRPALERSLRELQLDFLDLYLIHWPVSFSADCDHPKRTEQYLPPDDNRLVATWHAMEKLVRKGLLRGIGASNCKRSRLQKIFTAASIKPVVLQVECHPYLQQRELLDWCRKNNVVVTAFAPLGSGDRPENIRNTDVIELLDHPVLQQIAKETGRTPAAVALAWNLARGTAVIPKSIHPARLKENLQAASLSLSPSQRERIDQLNCGLRLIDGSPFCSEKSPYSLDWLWTEPD